MDDSTQVDTEPKVYIVSGSATGIGAATVARLAARGGRVVVNYSRNVTGAEETAERCRELGGQALVVKADISDEDQGRELVHQALDRWGRLDGLVNNAAATAKVDFFDLDGLSPAEFSHVLDVNVIGTFQLTRAALPALRQSHGAVVNVSSNVAFNGAGSSFAYNASKGAINAMTIALARICAPEVRVNAVCPGVVDTQWMAKALGGPVSGAVREANIAATPLGRIATADDVANAICWLLDDAPLVTGDLLAIDGGVRLAPRPTGTPQ